MQITIKEVTNNGNDLKGVTVNISVKEIAQMDKAGLHLFGRIRPEEPEGFPDEEVNWDECCLKHEPVKKEDLMKQEDHSLIECRTLKNKYFPEKYSLVMAYLKKENIDYELDKSNSTDQVVYTMTGEQLAGLQSWLKENEESTGYATI